MDQSFLISALVGGEQAVWRFGRFLHGRRTDDTHWRVDWVGRRAYAAALKDRKISRRCRDSNQPAAWSLYSPSYRDYKQGSWLEHPTQNNLNSNRTSKIFHITSSLHFADTWRFQCRFYFCFQVTLPQQPPLCLLLHDRVTVAQVVMKFITVLTTVGAVPSHLNPMYTTTFHSLPLSSQFRVSGISNSNSADI